jgi:hypothetical protein
LRQNPEFYADISSPVQNLVSATINIITNSETNHLIDEERRKKLLRSLFNAYYESVEQPTIFDTSRGWTSKTSLLKTLFPQTKIKKRIYTKTSFGTHDIKQTFTSIYTYLKVILNIFLIYDCV